MQIVLDTNVFVSHLFDLDAPDFQVLARAVDLGVASLVIPEVVVAEVERRFAETLQAGIDDAARAVTTIRRMTGATVPVEVDHQAACDYFRQRFEAWRKAHSAEVPPTSSVTSEMLVARSMKRLKPFKADSDQGMRDAIIWESVLRLSAAEDNDIILVTQNSRDFADSSKTALHADLLEEGRRVLGVEVRLFADLRALRSDSLDESVAEHQEDADLEGAKTFATNMDIHEMYEGDLILALEADLLRTAPDEFKDPTIPKLPRPERVTVDIAAGLGPRVVDVTVQLEYEIEAKGYASEAEWYILEVYAGYRLDEAHWNRSLATMIYTDTATVEVSLVVDMSGPRVTGFQVNSVTWGNR